MPGADHQDLAGLARRLRDLTGRHVELVEPLTGGACQDSFVVELDSEGGAKRYVLRSDAGSHLPGSLKRRDEFPIVLAAHSAGVTTPAVSHLAEDLVRPGASAYLMDFAAGEGLGGKIVGSPELEPARRTLLTDLATELVRIHSLTPETLTIAEPERDGALEVGAIDSALSLHRGALDALDAPHPALELVLAWLDDHRPAGTGDRPLVLNHGDFRTGNFLVTADHGLTAILDWEFAHWSVPEDDLGWSCVRDWRFGRLEQPAFGLGSRDELAAAYQRAGGTAIDPAALHYWEVMGNLRWAIGARVQGQRFAGGDGDIEHFAIGRRAVEIEFEALRLIERGLPGARPSWQPEAVQAAAAPPAPRDRRLAELSAALGGHQRQARAAISDRRQRFLMLVASDLVAQMEAEARAGGAIDDARDRAYSSLGTPDPTELCRRIRDRAVDFTRARHALAQAAAIELELIRPRFDRSLTLP